MIFKLRIDRWQPAPTNKLMRHWRSRSRLQTVDRNMVAHYCQDNRIPIATGPREVGMTITLGPGQRGCDVDAYWKSTLDALKRAKMLIDDNRQYCRIMPVSFDRGLERSTLITLTDL